MLDLSVVIPAYNEERRITRTLVSTYDFLAGRRFEIIVVCDGSTDSTRSVIESLPFFGSHLRLISYGRNKGKGYAIKTGVLAAKGAMILCQDADGSAPIYEISKLESALEAGFDIAIGSRNMSGSGCRLQVKQHRKLIGNSYNALVKRLLVDDLNDTQCGFKLYSRDCARRIFGLSVENGFSYDVEVLAIARALGFKTQEVAVDWQHVAGSKVNLALTPLRMFIDLFRIQRRVRALARTREQRTEQLILN